MAGNTFCFLREVLIVQSKFILSRHLVYSWWAFKRDMTKFECLPPRMQEEIRGLHEKEKDLQQKIKGLEREIAAHKREIKYRDDTIGEKEKKIYELKKKNQEVR